MSTEKQKGFHEKFIEIQALLKAPKDKFNKFGKYSYRSAESIVEAVKPLAHERGLYLTIDEELVSFGDKVYIKSVATLSDGMVSESATAFAREADSQAGMAPAQVTGSTSSYAKKYSLSNLFSIDDNQDADATNNHGKSEVEPKKDTVKQEPSLPILTIGHAKASAAIKAVNNGTYTLAQIKAKYVVSDEVLAKIDESKK